MKQRWSSGPDSAPSLGSSGQRSAGKIYAPGVTQCAFFRKQEEFSFDVSTACLDSFDFLLLLSKQLKCQ